MKKLLCNTMILLLLVLYYTYTIYALNMYFNGNLLFLLKFSYLIVLNNLIIKQIIVKLNG